MADATLSFQTAIKSKAQLQFQRFLHRFKENNITIHNFIVLNGYKALLSNVLQLKKALSTKEIAKIAGGFLWKQ